MQTTSSHAMGERPRVDPECFSSDKIRVEIGGEKFDFPRRVISILRGKDVINSRANKDAGSSSGSKACQKEEGGYLNIEYLSLDLTPKKCETAKECKIFKIDTYIKGYNSGEEFSSKGPFPNAPEELLKVCVPPKSPYSDFHKKYWSACNYSFSYNNLAIRIKFTGGGGIYPPEDIENTKQLVLDEIYKYKINQTN